MYNKKFAIRIKQARLNNGYTQQDVANITGISRTNITKYENGNLEPTLNILGALAKLYNVSIDWLLGIK